MRPPETSADLAKVSDTDSRLPLLGNSIGFRARVDTAEHEYPVTHFAGQSDPAMQCNDAMLHPYLDRFPTRIPGVTLPSCVDAKAVQMDARILVRNEPQ
jgi:hypothetical protein